MTTSTEVGPRPQRAAGSGAENLLALAGGNGPLAEGANERFLRPVAIKPVLGPDFRTR